MLRTVLAAVLLALSVSLAAAQPADTSVPARDARRGDAVPAQADHAHLPADAVTHHTLQLPGARSLSFTATAGAIRLTDADGKDQAELAFVAYQLDGADQMPDTGPGPAGTNRLRLLLHPAGHMFYTRDDQRAALHEARALVVGP